LESLNIPAEANAPFSATVTTEWTKILVDGSKQTNWNHRLIARDSSGRVFQERRNFMPDGAKATTPLAETDYADPNRHELFVCRPLQRVCYEYPYNERPYNQPQPLKTAPIAIEHPHSDLAKWEDLGRRTISGVDTEGSREIITLPAGVNGLERSEPVVKEFWYSPRLGVNVITKRFDPRSGVQNFTVGDINQSEPDPKLFVVPEGFRIVKTTP
jgi:hypothetical protein